LNLGLILYLADRILHADRVHALCLSYPHGHVQPRRISPLRFALEMCILRIPDREGSASDNKIAQFAQISKPLRRQIRIYKLFTVNNLNMVELSGIEPLTSSLRKC
jgi:hypothetical protein